MIRILATGLQDALRTPAARVEVGLLVLLLAAALSLTLFVPHAPLAPLNSPAQVAPADAAAHAGPARVMGWSPQGPVDHAGSGSLGVAYYRNGHYYLLSVGHVAHPVGVAVQDITTEDRQTLGSVSHTTGTVRSDGTVTDRHPGIALVHAGTRPLPPRLRIASQPARVPLPGGVVTLPEKAVVTLTATGRPENGHATDLPADGWVCHSGFSQATQDAGGFRCGELDEDCTAGLQECYFSAAQGGQMVASGDSGGPVWQPLANGTVRFAGIIRHCVPRRVGPPGGCGTAGFVPAWVYEYYAWPRAETRRESPHGQGGHIVLPPSPPGRVMVRGDETCRAQVSWRAGDSRSSDPVVGYRIYRNGEYIKSVGPATREYCDATPGRAESYTVAAYDRWGIERPAVVWGERSRP